jgi:multiple sugar transport system substrate-binding protein
MMKTWIRRGSQSAFALLAGTLLLSGEAFAQSLRFWTTEEQPDRLAKQEQMAADFKSQTGVSVEVIPISEKDLGTRATAAFAAGDLPDVIYHPLQYALPWAESGLLDTEAATEVIYGLRASTFSPGALDMAAIRGGYASVPVDGWTQLVVYRKDLFESHGLNPPNSYANIEAALQKLHNPPLMYGFVAPNKIDEAFMSQVLEHVFLSNGVSPVNQQGLQELDEKATVEVLNFYKKIQDASPEGELFWKQSREMFFAGQAAMIIWSPFILDELAGLRDSAPPTINSDPTSKELASKTGVITTLAGPSNPDGAAWADIRYFGITVDADTDNAMDFVRFSMTDGYVQTLSIAPEGKFPVRRGDAKNPELYLNAWSKLPVGVDRKAPLADLYPAEVISSIAAGLETANRWGVREGQLALASKIVNAKVLNRLVREFIDGERSATATARLMNQELAQVN